MGRAGRLPRCEWRQVSRRQQMQAWTPIMERLKTKISTTAYLDICIKMILAGHWMACIWGFVGVLGYDYGVPVSLRFQI